jgi:7-carboxy-7-deazaguanine synthase
MEMTDQRIVTTYPLMEAFYTVQGEGFHQGKAAFFIRLAGCDVGCVWCDVKESWDSLKYPLVNVKDMVAQASAYPSKTIVITGGEPLLHDCSSLTNALQAAGFFTHLETSGSSELSGNWNWICLSPKKFKAPLPSVAAQANELKIVVYHKSDFLWAEQWAQKVPSDCKLFLQPEWSRRDIVIPEIIDYVLRHPRWEVSMQIHKYLNVP